MKYLSTVLFLTLASLQLFAQNQIDTIEVYNVHCTLTRTNGSAQEFWSWGGNYCEFHNSIKCPSPVEKYVQNYLRVDSAMNLRKAFWMKLIDTNNVILYEGMKYSECDIGQFIDYYPSGKIRLIGQYSGFNERLNKVGLFKCRSKPIGTWYYYDINGELFKEEKK